MNVTCSVGSVASVHRATRRFLDGDSVEELSVAFVARYLDGAVRPQTGEIHDVAWRDSLPDETHPPADRIGADWLS